MQMHASGFHTVTMMVFDVRVEHTHNVDVIPTTQHLTNRR